MESGVAVKMQKAAQPATHLPALGNKREVPESYLVEANGIASPAMMIKG